LYEESGEQSEKADIPKAPVKFVEDPFNLKPKEYQAALIEDESKRIVVRWSRQAPKHAREGPVR
jgi:hypothetical protein